MFKNILVPTDGSPFSQDTVRRAVVFAKETGAEITAFYARPERTVPHYIGGVEIRQASLSAFDEADEKQASEILDFVAGLCAEAGVKCRKLTMRSNVVYEAIIAAASEAGCDLIFMASHGRSGLSALLLGSETVKVLTHSKIPVLVCR